MHFSSAAKALTLTKSHSHSHPTSSKDTEENTLSPTPSHHSQHLAPKIPKLTTLPHFLDFLTEHHHHRIIIFCLPPISPSPSTSSSSSPPLSPSISHNHHELDESEQEWYIQYEKLNGVRFAWIEDSDEGAEAELKDKLRSGVRRPCWVTFHKGVETGWVVGGWKRFRGLHK